MEDKIKNYKVQIKKDIYRSVTGAIFLGFITLAFFVISILDLLFDFSWCKLPYYVIIFGILCFLTNYIGKTIKIKWVNIGTLEKFLGDRYRLRK